LEKITKDQFLDVCILSGCDYLDNIPGIGLNKALKMMKKHQSVDRIVDELKKKAHLKFFDFEKYSKDFY